MDDQSSTKKKKKKRGTSLIFKNIFGKSTNSSNHHDDDLSSCSSPRISSDDNLVYCNVATNANDIGIDNGVDSPDQSIKKSSSSRGRMSKLFKAVLFDTAMKKKMRSKKSMKASSASCGSSPIPYDLNSSASCDSSPIPYDINMDKTLTETLIMNPNIFDKVSDVEDDPSNSNDHPIETPLSPPKAVAPVPPPAPPTPTTPTAPAPTALTETSSPTTTNPQILQTERKLTSRVDSMKKKPPLPPYSRADSIKKKSIPATTPTPPPTTTTKTTTIAATTTTTTTRDGKPAKNVNNPKARLFSLILLGIFVTVVLWTIYAAIATEPSAIDPEPYTDIVTSGGDEL